MSQHKSVSCYVCLKRRVLGVVVYSGHHLRPVVHEPVSYELLGIAVYGSIGGEMPFLGNQSLKIAIVDATQIERSYTYTKQATKDSSGVLEKFDILI